MCGITGFVSDTSSKEKIISKMNQLIHHRGPDEEGYFIDESVAMANKRLSIIDLSSGKQPIEFNEFLIVFNGEIYNYNELRDKLITKGYKFKTNSDTEVLLKMYAEYGRNCLQFLNGMFAFAIWDKINKTVFIARDRLGKKPLFYCFNGSDLVFGSEIKCLLAYPGVKRVLNTSVINSYFQYRYIIGDQTLFKNIFSLPAGCFLRFNVQKKNVEIIKYWELPIIKNKKDLGEKYYLKKTKDMLAESVRKRMISDVPVGAYLSGGLDSSIVVSLMSELNKGRNNSTFTIGFEEEGYNEFKYARMVAEKFKTDHHEIVLDVKNYLDTMDKLIGYKDSPLGVPNEVPLYLMSKELKKYITVVLSGEGSDELFGGYGRIFISYLDFNKLSSKNFLNFFINKYNYTSDEDLKKILSKKIFKEIDKKKYTFNIFKKYFDKLDGIKIEDKIPYIFQTVHLQGLLQRLDTTTMAASVEGRSPFVDHELIEFVNSIPFKYKIRWKNDNYKKKAIKKSLKSEEISESYDITKYLLRKVFKNDLPKEIINRKKIGFPVPLKTWLSDEFKNYAKAILRSKITLNRGIFNNEFVKSDSLFKELSSMTIWMMVNFELFLRKYFD
jgi:asparagine synthase (glutamine-hydrolysing)